MADGLVEQFKAKYETLSGQVHLTNDTAAVVDVVFSVLDGAKGRRLAVSELPDVLMQALDERCMTEGIALLKPPFDNRALPDSIDAADARRARFGGGADL